jgi:putative transcriptional regulator
LKPLHHLDQATILAYAAGTLNDAFSIVAASHLAWCEDCRASVRSAESVGGELLDQMPELQVSGSCRDKTLALIDRATVHRFPAPAPVASELPAPLAKVLKGASLNDLGWKKKAPGVAIYDVELGPGARGQLKLLRIGAGRAMPEHGHGGEEITLILKGAYHDHMGRFGRGDVADLDEEIEHKPVVDADGECICLVATEQPTRFKSLAARLMQPFIGI